LQRSGLLRLVLRSRRLWRRLWRLLARHRRLRLRWLPLPRENLWRVAAQRQQVRQSLSPRPLEWLVAALWKGYSQARLGLELAEVRLGMHSMARIVALQ
jgi:hypothetical protein